MRWFRRRLTPSDIAVLEHDGIRYDARALYRPRLGGGQWQRFAERVRRSYHALTGGTVEDRAINSVPWSRGDTLGPVSAGQAQALRLGAVWSAVRLICDTVSTLPVKSYRRAGDARTPAPLPLLLRRLDEDGTLVAWLWRCVSSLMLRGNAYGIITERDGMQFPTVIQWLDPDEVTCDDYNPWNPVWYWRGQVVPTEDFVHIPWFVVAGKVQGLSPIEAYAMSVSTGLQAQEYGTTWFSNGGVPPGTMRNTRQTINPDQANAISDRVTGAIKRRRPLVFGADWEFTPIQVSPEQAQFLETIQATAGQIAAIYGIPPEYVGGSTGDSMTYANVEQNQLRLLQSIRPILVRIENVLSAHMPNRQRVKFNADATARADLKTRLEAYQIGLTAGIYTVDEVRAYEDLPPLPPGADPAERHLPGMHNQKTHGNWSPKVKAAKAAQELSELKESIQAAQEKAAEFAKEAAASADSYSRPTSTPTRMTRGQYTKLLKDEHVRLQILGGKSEKEAKAAARPAATIDELKERNKSLRRELRDRGIDYRTDEQKRADDTEKDSLLDQVERLAVAGGYDGKAKRAGASRMSVAELRKFVSDAQAYQQRQAEKRRAAAEGAAAQAAFERRQATLKATDRQVDYILNLLARRRRSGEGGGFFTGPTDRAGIANLSRADASAYINSLSGNY